MGVPIWGVKAEGESMGVPVGGEMRVAGAGWGCARRRGCLR